MKMKALSLVIAVATATAVMSGAALAEGDAKKGKKVFNKCKACHSLRAGQNKIGPSLAGIFDRKAGGAEGFKYSKAMMDSGITWTEETMSAYLANPKDNIPGNKMAFAGLKKDAQRADVIAYLKEAAK